MKSLVVLAVILYSTFLFSQSNRDTLISAAKEMINDVPYCALITLDSSGHPDARTMDHFKPEENLIIWLATNINSSKVSQIKNDSRVTLYFAATNGNGYVMLKGNAIIINDPELEVQYWKEEWNSFYDDQRSNYALIKIVPNNLEIVDYTKKIISNSESWSAPFVDFKEK